MRKRRDPRSLGITLAPRKLVLVLVVIVSLGALVFFSTTILAGELSSNQESSDELEWLMFRRDSSRSGASISTDGPREGILLWQAPIGPITSSSVIAEEKVFVGTLDGKFYALNLHDGSIIWEVDVNLPIASSPAFDKGRIFFGTLKEGSASVAGGGPNVATLASGLYALSARDGSIIWLHEMNSSIYSSPLISEDYLVFGTTDGRIVALDPDNGDLRWMRKTGGQVLSSPAVESRELYVGSNDGMLYSFDLITGSSNWLYDLNSSVGTSSPALTENFVLIGTLDGRVNAVERDSGTLAWSYSAGGAILSSPLIVDETVMIASNDQMIHALRISDGGLLWTSKFGGEIWSSPSFASGIVYFGSIDGKIYALDMTTASPLWSFATMDFIDSSPAIAQQTMIIGGRDGHLYAFRDQ
ncbi:MAG: PQQ-binding-like beta-propeller repeat protein [Nitrososphaerales archaeon]